jgi:hypothetical protein
MTKPSTDVELVRKLRAITAEQQAAIDAEDAADFASLTPEQQKRRKNREAKRRERRGKQEANAELKAAKLEDAIRKADSRLSIQKFWDRNRGRLDEDTRATYLERHETVMEFVGWMWRWLHGYQDEAEFFQIDRNDMEAFIKEHGTHNYYELRQKPDGGYENRLRIEVEYYKNNEDEWRASVAGQPFAEKIFLSTGLLLSMPSELVSAFYTKFPKTRAASTVPQGDTTHGTQETNTQVV